MSPFPLRVDRLVARAMLACVVAAALMLANRWMVAGQQAGAMAALLIENARAVAIHSLADHVPQTPGAASAAQLSVREMVAVSPHHLAATLISPQGEVVSQARASVTTDQAQRLADRTAPQDGEHLDAQGHPQPWSEWRWIPTTTTVQLDAGAAGTLRLLVSMRVPRENQRYIFVQGVKSVALALAVVLVVVLLLLREPRRSLIEAARYAAKLPYQTPPALVAVKSGLSDIDALRESLNQVGTVLEQQRQQHRVDELQLLQAAREAQAATEAKSTFLAHMSHEIRTPLTGVLGLTDVVLNTPLTQVQQQHLRTVRESAQHLMQIVNEVLDLSKIDAGRLHLEAVPFSLYALLDEACKPFAVRAADKSIELINEVCPNLPLTVVGDPMRLRQVLVNLIGNAIKFTATGHVRLHVEGTAPSSTLASSDSVVIAFHVSDTGPGIPEDQRARIFDAFVQVDASTARRFGGTGLGLSITTRLLDLMNTPLRVTSQVGQGSSFSFELRLGLPPPPQTGHLTHYRHLPGERVLWADASSQAVPWYHNVFGMWSMEMDHAVDLDSTLRLLQRHRYQTVFFDLSAASAAHHPAADTAVALQAVLQGCGDARLCLMLGPTDTLPPTLERPDDQLLMLMKPVSPQDLNRALTGERAAPRTVAAPLRLDGLQLLVVDDNEVNLLVTQATLAGLGAQTQTVGDGATALALLQAEHRFDAVLMDLHMPVMDGLETTRRLRQMERERGHLPLPVVALTATDSDTNRGPWADAGMDGFVGKPIQTAQLVGELRSVMARQAARHAAFSGRLANPVGPANAG